MRGQRQRQLLSLTHGRQQALSAERQLLHPIQIGDKARFHIIGHQHPLQPLAGHLDVLAEYLFQLVQVGFGIGTADILQIAGDTRGNELRLVAHGALAGGLLQQQIRRPLVGILKADKFHLQLVALLQCTDPLPMLGQHLIRQAIKLGGSTLDLLEAGTSIRYVGKFTHLLTQLGEAVLLLLELIGQLRQLGGIFTGAVDKHPAVTILQCPLETCDSHHQRGCPVRYGREAVIYTLDFKGTDHTKQDQQQQHQHESGDDPLHDR